MEIALFRYNGEEIVDQLISLVHPHKKVQEFVSRMTGITEKMLLRAPRFHELAKRIVELTEDSILVGHNVEFDYRMLRQEFARLGYPFEIRTLDTITLSRELLPGLKTYGLDSVCRELGIYNSQAHRAEGDARATLELFKMLKEKDSAKNISILGQSILENTVVSDKIQDLKRSVKKNRGVYYLHDKQGNLLYMDFSLNIRKELNKLFMADTEEARRLREETHSIKAEATGTWLIAMVKLQEEIRRARPKYGEIKPLHFDHSLILDKGKSGPGFGLVPLLNDIRSNQLFKVYDRRSGLRAIRLHKRMGDTESASAYWRNCGIFPPRHFIALRDVNPKKGVYLW